jgi:DNA helicase-2/ATP-dependent DNA helicase PcrA
MQTLDDSSTDVNGSHADDLAALVQVASVHPDPRTFETWLREALSRPGHATGVRLASVHRVKGLEFDHVVALGVHRPHDLAVDVEEERRIAHVAITRARRTATVIALESESAPFVDEMAGREPREPVAAPRRREVAPVAAASAPAGATDDDAPVVEARTGLVVHLRGGDEGEITAVEPAGATVSFAGGGWTRVPWGTGVRTEAGRARLEPPGYAAVADALTAWRADRARRDAVPAYVVMHNTTRDGIARARPTNVVALSRCPGIGPTKLERYGDDILVVVETALGGADAGA